MGCAGARGRGASAITGDMTSVRTLETFVDLDPATGEPISEVPRATPRDVEEAVRAARAAQPAWARLPVDERSARLGRALERLGAEADELAELVTREMGKLIDDARREARGWAAHGRELLAEVTRAVAPQVQRGERYETTLSREPHGVVAVITPWNFPIGMPLQILLPALAAGNAVVFKPSEHTPLVGERIAQLFEAELPAGVLRLVQGGGDVGASLVAADVDMIGFVGSRETGRRIMASASQDLKRLVLELGGKDPLVVFADADLDAAADCAVRHALRNTGQVCCSVERVYVAREVAADFEHRVVERAREWRHGNGFDPQARMGPMVSGEQRAKVDAQVRDALARGARCLLGGEVPAGAGFFYPATVLADVGGRLEISRVETFGPVVALTPFSGDEEEAVRLANDTVYGLGASVFSGDLERGRRVAARIRAGQVGVNRYLSTGEGLPWVGARQSGFGYLGGIEGHRQFTLPKSVSVAREEGA